MDKWGNGSKSQRESPSVCDFALDIARTRSCPRRDRDHNRAFPVPFLSSSRQLAFQRMHTLVRILARNDFSGSHHPSTSPEFLRAKKRPPQTRRALLTQSRNLLRSPAAYSPNAFFSALTRLRLTGIFSSTPFSVSSSVPPETDSISSTMERFTRYPRCTRKNPWPSRRFSS